MAAIIAAVAAGDVTPAEAASLARVIDRYMFARSVLEFEQRQLARAGRDVSPSAPAGAAAL
jgi:hypothetical protein